MTESRGHLIGGSWHDGGGAPVASTDPATGQTVWCGRAATETEVEDAVSEARQALVEWSDRKVEQRIECLRAFEQAVEAHRAPLVEAICLDTGKPLWEARSEVDLMIAKVGVSIEAFEQRCGKQALSISGATGTVGYRPHGVVAVLGPFNLPGHLPNGHIVPALLAGNTIVFKPSEFTPLVGQRTAEAWREAGFPDGVLNLIQGGADTGRALARHEDLNGLFFTGSYRVGQRLSQLFADHPEKILALEMGGNNPLVVDGVEDLDAAAHLTVLSAFITAGQRCTCARRLIVPAGDAGDRFLEILKRCIEGVRVGRWNDEPQPFHGPLISVKAAERLLEVQRDLVARGGRSLVEMKQCLDTPALLTPGLLDVSTVKDRVDDEWFGPLLQLVRVKDLDEAIEEASRTAYGLSAALFSDSEPSWAKFYHRVRAGVVNWNRQTTGASGRLPFGGVGRSGNHRPSGYYAVDYCAHPVASLEAPRLEMPAKRLPGTGS